MSNINNTNITINHIKGRRGSVCRNDALSVVANGKTVLDIIPKRELDRAGKTATDVLSAFSRAVENAGNNPTGENNIKQAARQQLGLNI